MKAIVRSLWRRYVGVCLANSKFAIPMPTRLAAAGRIWCHPAYCRHSWGKDSDRVFQTLAALLESGDILFDVGANIGLTAMIGARKVGRTGKVVAFEPSQPNVEMLQYHLRWNRIKNVQVEATCVGNTKGTVKFSLLGDGVQSSNSLTFSRKSEAPFVRELAHTVLAPITTLDRYCSETGLTPQVIKIDVEGAELDVLQGAKETIRRCRPTLLIGVHPFWWPDSQDPAALTELLRSLDYRTKTTLGEIGAPEIYADFLCEPL